MSDAKKLSSMDASFLYLETPEMPRYLELRHALLAMLLDKGA